MPRSGVTVFIGQLSYHATEDDLYRSFDKFGRILDARITKERDSGRSRGFGFIDFADDRGADEAILHGNGMDICGKSVKVALADSGGDDRRRRSRSPGFRGRRRSRSGGRGGGDRRGGGGGYGGGGGGGGGGSFRRQQEFDGPMDENDLDRRREARKQRREMMLNGGGLESLGRAGVGYGAQGSGFDRAPTADELQQQAAEKAAVDAGMKMDPQSNSYRVQFLRQNL